MKIREGVRYFDHLSCYYRRFYQQSNWEQYENHADDPWEALALVLRGYAYERAGRSPEFAPAAADAVLCASDGSSEKDGSGVLAELAWANFRRLLPRRGVNERVNPLYPSTDPDGPGVAGHASLVEVAFDDPLSGQPITTFCRDLLHADQVDLAFSLLTQCRGIGRKIASFFLRDLGGLYGVEEGTDHRHLLQPIDLWVRRVVFHLVDDNSFSDEDVAKWIVARSLEVDASPEWVNAGMWFFGADLAESEYALNRAMASMESAHELERGYRERLERAASCGEEALRVVSSETRRSHQ